MNSIFRAGSGSGKSQALVAYEECFQKYSYEAARDRVRIREFAQSVQSAPRARTPFRCTIETRHGPAGNIHVFGLSGDLDLHDTPELSSLFAPMIGDALLVDCSQLNYIDSSGLAVLIEAMQNTEALGKPFELCAINDSVSPILEIARMDQVFIIRRSREQSPTYAQSQPSPFGRNAEVRLQELDAEFMAYFEKHPDRLHQTSPERFECVILEILKAMGYETQRVGGSGDQGRDILATLKTPLGPLLIVVQCKRYRPNQAIRPDALRSLMCVINDLDKATYGLLATTARFGPQSYALQRQFRHRVTLADFERIKDWLVSYGKWRTTGDARIWVPGLWEDSPTEGDGGAKIVAQSPIIRP